jgi:lipopolysaccharide biosynthesis glycosyltransferase
MLNTTVNLALAFDKGYITPFNVLLTSIFKNNRGNKIKIHVIATGVNEVEQRAIIDYAEKNGHEIAFYEVDHATISKFSLPDHEGAYLTAAVYYRLFFASLVPQDVDRLIYIDVDTLVVGNLAELAAADIGHYPIGAVIDTDMPVRTDLGIHSTEDYFNSGVMLIDRARWLEQKITEQCIQVIHDEPERIKQYADQDVLNMVLMNNWYKLDSRFNLMRLYVPNEVPKRDFNKFLADKIVVHFNGRKPWFKDSITTTSSSRPRRPKIPSGPSSSPAPKCRSWCIPGCWSSTSTIPKSCRCGAS